MFRRSPGCMRPGEAWCCFRVFGAAQYRRQSACAGRLGFGTSFLSSVGIGAWETYRGGALSGTAVRRSEGGISWSWSVGCRGASLPDDNRPSGSSSGTLLLVGRDPSSADLNVCGTPGARKGNDTSDRASAFVRGTAPRVGNWDLRLFIFRFSSVEGPSLREVPIQSAQTATHGISVQARERAPPWSDQNPTRRASTGEICLPEREVRTFRVQGVYSRPDVPMLVGGTATGRSHRARSS